MIRFASLGSGSEGNGLVVEAGRTRVLLDCGFGLSETTQRLARLGLAPEQLSAIAVTHEHSDHIGGVARFARKHRLPVWLTHGTRSMWDTQEDSLPEVRIFDSHSSFAVEEVEIHPYPVPHDAREPVQFVFSDGGVTLGVLTDTGCSTPHIEAMLSGLDALVLECNHDSQMLREGPYPAGLKQRVAGRLGHLENAQAAGLLKQLDCSRLKHVVAAHISRKNNTPALARRALAQALDCAEEWIGVAHQEDGFDWRSI
jgi:phosphoribosyl 1,2-cyclic phosphodiesterase